MIKLLNYRNSIIRYSVKGEGICVVLLHGYLESLDVWSEFFEDLSTYYKVVAIDLPGHGESGNLDEIHSMDLMGECINFVLENEKIKKCVIFGHSMGGYVTLAFLQNNPDKLLGFSLFHSHPFEDTNAVRNRRKEEIEFIKKGKKDLIIKANVPRAFSKDNLVNLKDDIEIAKGIARITSEQGMISALRGMMERPNREELLKNSKIPFLLVLGKKDNFINYNVIRDKIQLPLNSKVLVLELSGHMGFIEEKQKLFMEIIMFLDEIKKKR